LAGGGACGTLPGMGTPGFTIHLGVLRYRVRIGACGHCRLAGACQPGEFNGRRGELLICGRGGRRKVLARLAHELIHLLDVHGELASHDPEVRARSAAAEMAAILMAYAKWADPSGLPKVKALSCDGPRAGGRPGSRGTAEGAGRPGSRAARRGTGRRSA
jgi:hypothetical protein